MTNKTLHILALCGIGDILSHIARFPNLEQQYTTSRLKVWLGGFGKSPQFMKEILECETFNGEPIEASIIKNLTFHNQLPSIRQFLKVKVEKSGDHLMDWSFCEEIFQNIKPVFKQYEMNDKYDYKYRLTSDVKKFQPLNLSNLVCVQPYTKSGNAEGFESDVEKGRFWPIENWKKICDYLSRDGFTIGFTGYGDEDGGLIEYCQKQGYKHYNFVGYSVADTFEILSKHSEGNIACNSWTWEITSRAMIPTVCLYTKNHFFIQNHMPDNGKVWDSTYIETGVQRSADDLYEVWKYMWDRKYEIGLAKRPKVDYSVCMITYNDEECIKKTLDNIRDSSSYLPETVIVDGGSTDKTLSIIKEYDSFVNTYHNKWPDSFEEQKNYALAKQQELNSTSDWCVWIDADETYEPIFWNQLPWYIMLADKNGIDCISVPRINTLVGLDQKEFEDYVQKQGWQVSGFNWINYPDFQQRVFKSNCKFVGRTHERIVGANNEGYIVGVHCLHPKTKQRQDRGLEREYRQYEIEAEKIYERVMKDES